MTLEVKGQLTTGMYGDQYFNDRPANLQGSEIMFKNDVGPELRKDFPWVPPTLQQMTHKELLKIDLTPDKRRATITGHPKLIRKCVCVYLHAQALPLLSMILP
jgi:hypothetical protein